MNDASANTDQHFDTDHLVSDLKGRSLRGGVATVSAQVGKTVLTLGALTVLARLLTPADFGLIAMAAAITGFITMFKSLGLSKATVQSPEVTHDQVNALFWINATVGLGIALLTAASAPLVAWFYDEPHLVGVTAALACAIFLSGLAVQHQALLERQMRFTVLAIANIISVAGSVIVAILSAWIGAGYWALVFQQLTAAGLLTVGVWSVCRWRPSRPAFVAEGVWSMLAFGGHLTGFRFVNYFARHADDVLIGRYLGAASLGLYDKAYKLLLAPISLFRSPISNVVLPALSRLQTNPKRYRAYVREALAAITFLSMPLITFCFAEAERIILLVLGPQWIESVAIFRVLALVALIQSFNMVTGWSFTSLGQTNRWFRWGLFSATITVVGFIAGLPWGAYGVAVSYAVTTYLILIPGLIYCFKTSILRLHDVFGVIWKPALTAILAAAITLLVDPNVAHTPARLASQLLLTGGLFTTVYLFSWLLLPGGRTYLVRIFGLIRELISR